MTDTKQRARRVVEKCYRGPFARYGSVDEWAKEIEQALLAERQAVWKKVIEKAKFRDWQSSGAMDCIFMEWVKEQAEKEGV